MYNTLIKVKIRGYYRYADGSKLKIIAIPIRGHGGLWGCEMLRIPHFLDNWHTDGSEVVSLMHQPYSSQKKIFISVSGTHFC
jgi:hypothetical protein